MSVYGCLASLIRWDVRRCHFDMLRLTVRLRQSSLAEYMVLAPATAVSPFSHLVFLFVVFLYLQCTRTQPLTQCLNSHTCLYMCLITDDSMFFFGMRPCTFVSLQHRGNPHISTSEDHQSWSTGHSVGNGKLDFSEFLPLGIAVVGLLSLAISGTRSMGRLRIGMPR